MKAVMWREKSLIEGGDVLEGRKCEDRPASEFD
jgi:hypothetical protein